MTAPAPTPRARVWRTLRWLVTGTLLVLVVRLVDWSALGDIVVRADPRWLALAMLIAFADRGLMCAKWLPLLRAQLPAFPLGRAIRGYFAANVGILVLPAAAGADVLRAVALGRGSGHTAEIAASVAAERVHGIAASAVAGSIALGLASTTGVDLTALTPWFAGFLALASLAVIFPVWGVGMGLVERTLERFRDNAIGAALGKFARAYTAYRDHRLTWAVVWLASVIEQAVPVIVLWCVARSLSLDVSLVSLAIAVPLAMMVARLPISAAGLGVLEGGLVFFLGRAGVPATETLAIVLGARIIETISLLPGIVWWQELTRRQPDEPST